MDNYRYCAEFVLRRIKDKPEAKILDFGCGTGRIVKLLRDNGVAAFGCDVFYGGGASPVPDDLSGIVIAMPGNVIPFPASTFDTVINNQVMEHVEDIDAVLCEIHRVLKPGGLVLSLFPDHGIWREGHCGVPFLHWFPKHSAFRIYYALAWRSIGFGHFTEGKSRFQWSKDFCDWLDDWTVYRSYKEVSAAYEKYFAPMQHIEDDWLDKRLGPLVWPFPKQLKRVFVKKMAGLVFTESGLLTARL
jgi:SAM-dependent methyltransferase